MHVEISLSNGSGFCKNVIIFGADIKMFENCIAKTIIVGILAHVFVGIINILKVLLIIQ